MISFKTWIKKYINHDNPRGDLARDMYDDRTFPDTGNYNTIHSYLISRLACDAALRTFKNAYKSYNKAILGGTSKCL